MANATLQPIYERLNGVSAYHPLTADTFQDWTMEAGDVITVRRGAEEYNVPVQSMSLVWKGRQQISIDSTGNRERDPVAKMSAKKYGRGGAAMRSNENLYRHFGNEDARIQAELEMTASQLHIEFENGITGLQSELEMTASHLETEFTDMKNQLEGELEMTASHLRTEFTDGLNSLHSEFEITASHLQAEFENSVSGLQSELEMTASHLQAEFTSDVNSLRGEMDMTASHLQTEFEDGLNSVRSEVEQTASSWAASVSGVVDANGNITAASIAIAINNSTGQSEAKISADRVYIGNEKSSTVIAGKITLSDVTADYIGTQLASLASVSIQEAAILTAGITTVRAANIYFASSEQGQSTYTSLKTAYCNLQIAQSGDTYTLQGKTFADSEWQDIGSFSRATTLSGAWGSGADADKFIVLASPQGDEYKYSPPLRLNGTTQYPNFSAEITDSGGVAKKSVYGYLIVTTDGSSSYVDVNTASDGSGTSVARVSIGNLYTAGYTAGQNSVTVTKGSWSGGQITFSKSAGTASTQQVKLVQATPTWDESTNIASVVMWDGNGASAQQGTNTGYTVTVDASARYTAGKNAVTLNDAAWNSVSSITSSRTVTVSTSGRPTQLSKSKTVHLTVGTWSSGSIPIYIRDGSTSGTIVAQNSVNIPAKTAKNPTSNEWVNTTDDTWKTSITIGGVERESVTKDFSGIRTEGKNAVTLNDAAWNSVSSVTASRTVTVSTSGRPTQLSKSKTVHLTVGTWSSGSIPIHIRDGSTTGTIVAQNSVNIPAKTAKSPTSNEWVNTTGRTWKTTITIGGVERESVTKNFDSYYTDGQDSVTLTDPTWNTVQSIGNNRTVTVSTVNRGTTLSKSKTFYLTKGSWSNGSITVYARENSSSGEQVANTSVSISASDISGARGSRSTTQPSYDTKLTNVTQNGWYVITITIHGISKKFGLYVEVA